MTPPTGLWRHLLVNDATYWSGILWFHLILPSLADLWLHLLVCCGQEVSDLRQKNSAHCQDVSDLQEALQWKEKKIGVLWSWFSSSVSRGRRKLIQQKFFSESQVTVWDVRCWWRELFQKILFHNFWQTQTDLDLSVFWFCLRETLPARSNTSVFLHWPLHFCCCLICYRTWSVTATGSVTATWYIHACPSSYFFFVANIATVSQFLSIHSPSLGIFFVCLLF